MILLEVFLTAYLGVLLAETTAILLSRVIYDWLKLKRRQYRRNKRLKREINERL